MGECVGLSLITLEVTLDASIMRGAEEDGAGCGFAKGCAAEVPSVGRTVELAGAVDTTAPVGRAAIADAVFSEAALARDEMAEADATGESVGPGKDAVAGLESDAEGQRSSAICVLADWPSVERKSAGRDRLEGTSGAVGVATAMTGAGAPASAVELTLFSFGLDSFGSFGFGSFETFACFVAGAPVGFTD